MSLKWYESCDALDNTMWEAPGPYTDELGSPEFLFRLHQNLVADKVVWQDHSDPEISTPSRRGRTWDTLEEAKDELEKEASEMVVGACPKRIEAEDKVSCRYSSLTRETGEVPNFRTEYLCEPAPRIPARLWELAEDYHARTEEFDRRVCTGPMARGEVMPADGRELVLINRNARELRDALRHLAQAEGFSAGALDAAIGVVGVEFSYDAWLKKNRKGVS